VNVLTRSGVGVYVTDGLGLKRSRPGNIYSRDIVLSQRRGYLSKSTRDEIQLSFDFNDCYYSNIQILINTNKYV